MDYNYLVISTLELEESGYLENLVDQLSKSLSSKFDSKELLFKYKDNHIGYSIHSLLILNDNIIAAFTCMPRKIGNKSILFGCDTFVDKNHRKNIFILRNLFQSLKKSQLNKNYSFIMGIPNEKASLYWNKIAKWKIKSELDLVLLPVIPSFFKFLFACFYFLIVILFFSKKKNKLFQDIKNIKKFKNYMSTNNIYCKNYIEFNKNVTYLFGFSQNSRLELANNIFKTIITNGNSIVLVGYNTQLKILRINKFIKRKFNVHIEYFDEIILENIVFDIAILDNR